ncbi:MAG: glycine zipper 2TM domain-containing protein [Verrucomicrobiota bacterium]|nr:MAG: glycine zipper 2TM domain-containing protein [Verrucomicrobiota bacterium]
MEFPFLKTGVVLALVVLLGGCDSTESTLGGAGVGAATGALLGHAVGGRGGAALGGVLGGLGGGAVGHSIGRKQMEAKSRASQAEEEARYYQRENEYLRNHGSQSSRQESIDQEKRLQQLKFEAEEARLKGELAKAKADQAEAERRQREVELKKEGVYSTEFRSTRYQEPPQAQEYTSRRTYAH